MKKLATILLAGLLSASILTGCGQGSDTQESTQTETETAEETTEAAAAAEESVPENTTIETLRIAFVPSREPEEIITATEPLKQLLTDELAKLGYDVQNGDITVGTSYEAVGEALSAGTADVGLIPGGTYVLYDDGCDVLCDLRGDCRYFWNLPDPALYVHVPFDCQHFDEDEQKIL